MVLTFGGQVEFARWARCSLMGENRWQRWQWKEPGALSSAAKTGEAWLPHEPTKNWSDGWWLNLRSGMLRGERLKAGAELHRMMSGLMDCHWCTAATRGE